MTEENRGGGATVAGVRELASRNPSVERLVSEAETYLRNRAEHLVTGLGDRITDTADRLEDIAANGGALGKGAKALSEGSGPMGAGIKAGASLVKDKVSGLVKRGDGSGGAVKATQIAEQIDIGVPVSVAYNQWTQFEEFGKFTKGVESVEQTEDDKTNWRAKVAFSHRSWEATITEQIPDQRIAWTSDGEKGHVDGVVTFHELAPNLTRVMLQMEYYPQGVFEKVGNLWRAQGRRARLDLKHFRRYVMMRGEESGSWRGEIHDGEVKRSRTSKGRSSGSSGDKRGGGAGSRGQHNADNGGSRAKSNGGNGGSRAQRGSDKDRTRRSSGQSRSRAESSSGARGRK